MDLIHVLHAEVVASLSIAICEGMVHGFAKAERDTADYGAASTQHTLNHSPNSNVIQSLKHLQPLGITGSPASDIFSHYVEWLLHSTY